MGALERLRLRYRVWRLRRSIAAIDRVLRGTANIHTCCSLLQERACLMATVEKIEDLLERTARS